MKLVVLAIPTADGRRMREIVNVCRRLHVQTKTIPSLPDRVQGDLGFSAVREVLIEDLLRRDPVKLDLEQVGQLISARTVLVTGAGGSIGSELCRQALRFTHEGAPLRPRGERALRDRARAAIGVSHRDLVPLIGDVTDRERVEQVFRRSRPDVVFHAAAHKHVPMMEANACEAIKNNVFGTSIRRPTAEHRRRGVRDDLHRQGGEPDERDGRDQARGGDVRPGASRSGADDAIRRRALRQRARHQRAASSRSSSEQIARGGPVTVTHPE